MYGPQNPTFAPQNMHAHINMMEVTATHITEMVKHLSIQNPGLMDAVIRNLAIANQHPRIGYLPYGLPRQGGPGLNGATGQMRATGWPQPNMLSPEEMAEAAHRNPNGCQYVVPGNWNGCVQPQYPTEGQVASGINPEPFANYFDEERQTQVYWTPTGGGKVAAVRFNWWKLRGITKEAACNLAKVFAGFTFFSAEGASLTPQDIYVALITSANTDSPVAMRDMTVFVNVAEIDVLDRAMARSWDGLSLSQGNQIINPKEDIKAIYDKISAGKTTRIDVSLIDYGNSMGNPQDQKYFDTACKALVDLGVIRTGVPEFWLWSVEAPRAGLEEEVRRALKTIGSDKLNSGLKIFKTL